MKSGAALLTVLLMLVVAACGGSDGSPLLGSGDQPDPLPAAGEIADVIVGRLGPDDGFDATALALDTGYLVAQIVDGADTLDRNGLIPGATPAGPGYGLFGTGADAAGTIVLAAGMGPAAFSGDALDEFGDRFTQEAGTLTPGADTGTGPSREGAEFVAILLALVDGGYSLEQIVEGMLFGEVTPVTGVIGSGDDERYPSCIALIDSDGVLVTPRLLDGVAPALRSGTDCRNAIRDGRLMVGSADTPVTTTTSSDTVPLDPISIVYRGEGDHKLTTYYSADDETVVCDSPGPMELLLAPDGVVTFTYFDGVGLAEKECQPRPGNAWTGSYDAGLATFAIGAPSAGLDDWEFEGLFNATHAFGSGEYSYTSTIGEDFVRTTVTIDFNLTRVP